MFADIVNNIFRRKPKEWVVLRTGKNEVGIRHVPCKVWYIVEDGQQKEVMAGHDCPLNIPLAEYTKRVHLLRRRR